MPVAASNATQYSCKLPLPSSFDIIAKARPWLTANELNPLVMEKFVQTTGGPPTGQFVEMSSLEIPSVVGPRYCGQSLASTFAQQTISRPTAAVFPLVSASSETISPINSAKP